jgi:chaperonin GroES
MGIKPMYDRILVERSAGEATTSAGIIIPETAKDKPLEGFVRAVGQGRRNDAGELVDLVVKEGDKILFGKYSGNEVTIEGREHLILREDEVLAIITD